MRPASSCCRSPAWVNRVRGVEAGPAGRGRNWAAGDATFGNGPAVALRRAGGRAVRVYRSNLAGTDAPIATCVAPYKIAARPAPPVKTTRVSIPPARRTCGRDPALNKRGAKPASCRHRDRPARLTAAGRSRLISRRATAEWVTRRSRDLEQEFVHEHRQGLGSAGKSLSRQSVSPAARNLHHLLAGLDHALEAIEHVGAVLPGLTRTHAGAPGPPCGGRPARRSRGSRRLLHHRARRQHGVGDMPTLSASACVLRVESFCSRVGM